MRRNKRDILNESIVKKPKADVFLFGFDQYTTLVWYAPKSNSSVLLLLTMHYDNHVEKHWQIKYLFFFFYNSTKGAIDRVDQLYHPYSVQIKSNR